MDKHQINADAQFTLHICDSEPSSPIDVGSSTLASMPATVYTPGRIVEGKWRYTIVPRGLVDPKRKGHPTHWALMCGDLLLYTGPLGYHGDVWPGTPLDLENIEVAIRRAEVE